MSTIRIVEIGVLAGLGARRADRENRSGSGVRLHDLADIEPCVDEPEKSEDRYQRRECGQSGRCAGIERFGSQPRANTDATMNPEDEQEQVLPGQRKIRRNDPKLIQHPGKAKLEAVSRFPDRDGSRVGDEQQRNGEPQRKLPSLARRDAQMSPAIERIEPERAMSKKRGIKQEPAGYCLPRREKNETGALHGIDRSDAECVIEQVRCRIGKQDQSRCEANRPL